MDPHLFDSCVGHYEFPGKWIMTVSRENEHFWVQLQGQPRVEVFPEGRREFFASIVDAQISFETDAQGRPTGLVLKQEGQDTHALRMDDATAQKLIDTLNARIQSKVPVPGSEQALRRYLQESASGEPDYVRMSPVLAAATRAQLPYMRRDLERVGPLVSLKFTGVDPMGMDVYQARFEHGSSEWRIDLGPGGKINGVSSYH
jgi:hypothetical protein